MVDREKVINGLQIHAGGCGYRSHYCDAMECPYRYGDMSCDIEEMCRDALALLKEQEAVEPICQIIFDVPYYFCGNCKTMLNMYAVKAKYCSNCARMVKWE